MTLFILPTLYPARTIDIDGHGLKVAIVMRDRDFAVRVSGPIRVGRFDYELTHVESIDARRNLYSRFPTTLSPAQTNTVTPRPSTIKRHQALVHERIATELLTLRSDREWAAAAECLAAYDRMVAWMAHLGRRFYDTRFSSPWYRAAGGEPAMTDRDLLMAQAGNLCPGPALPLVMQLIKDLPSVTLPELESAALSVCPELAADAEWTHGSVAKGALAGHAACLERLGWCVVHPA